MEFKPKFVTVDDYKNFSGKDLRNQLKSDDNESNQAERFLYLVEEHLMTWIDHKTFRKVGFDCLTPYQLEKFQLAILYQAQYTFKQGSLALGLENGVDAERGVVITDEQISQTEVCHAAIEHLSVAGLFNLKIKNRKRFMNEDTFGFGMHEGGIKR